MSGHWNLRRWVRESQSYMAHRPRWEIAIRALFKWPKFALQQRRDEHELASRRDCA